MRNSRSFWIMVVISLVAVTLLQGLAGTPTSPVERWLHIAKVPAWWPFFLAALTGIGGGIILNRQMGQQGGPTEQSPPASGRGQRGPQADPKKGRYAVPRHVRRERERERRRAERRADAEFRAREAAEAAARAAEAASADQNPPPSGWLGRLGGVLSRRPR